MSPRLELLAIARRVRALIAGRDGGDLAVTANRLRVHVDALARSIDLRFPDPTLPVLTAVVREYGVDPSWLLYGEYDPRTHSIASEMGTNITRDDIVRIVTRGRTVDAVWRADDAPDVPRE